MLILTGVRSGSLESLSSGMFDRPAPSTLVRLKNQVLVNDDAQRPARTDRDRRLDVQVLLDGALAGRIGALRRRLSDRLHEIALRASKRGLGTDAKERREGDALQELP